MKEYELMSPYGRYGLYQQELFLHTTVYSYLEVHNVKDPGIVTKNEGMATISNIGISSIPGREFVTHGGLLIPAGARTSRIEWNDIWGRQWEQPLRSLFPDIPPIPPPLKNFVMSTTYEILDRTGERILEWPSDENAYVHVQLKFLNNYPKYFLPITCPANGYPYAKYSSYTYAKDRMFTDDDIPDTKIDSTVDEYKNKSIAVSFGFRSVYGKCFTTKGSMLSGSYLTDSDFNQMDYAMTCSESNDATKIKQCENELSQIKTLKRRPDNNTDDTDYNYSPTVEAFYPKNYIKRNMWDLTHYDYDDNAMDKAYKYHIDNNLPSIDVCPPQNPATYKPHNTVTFPLYKGFGYQMSYDPDKWIPSGTQKSWLVHKGWWSDNLQNQDNTLLAGQSESNDISVGKSSLISNSQWIGPEELNAATNAYLEKTDPKYSEHKDWVKKRLKNIYVCEFNRHRIRVSPNQKIYAFPENVYMNNVVPIHPDFKDNDERYTNFNCTGDQYVPTNISKMDNRVYTVSDRDWLYFTLNLRGGARENIHILMSLTYFTDRKYEGVTKIQDGGRFVYWNPVLGPNAYLNVENPVNVIESYRVDLEVEELLYPNTIDTFNGEIYKVFIVRDENEILRSYDQTTYSNSYGFGDSTITTFVGGTLGSVCSINVGETTYIKITFYNNCGFDWNLKGNAIDFEQKGVQTISANDLLNNKYHAIQAPLSYNFMTLQIPDDLKDCLEIIPSDHNIDTAPQFFDFENINVATIRDGFEGNYYYKLKIIKQLPKKYWGKLVEIPIKLNEEYFDNLPNINDETKIHNYTLTIPPIKFGYPYTEGNYTGKVFVTYGRADSIIVSQVNNKYIKVAGAKFITDDDHFNVNQYTFDDTTAVQNIRKLFDSLNENIPYIDGTNTKGNSYTNFTFNTTKYKIFPTEIEGIPDIAEYKFIVKYTSNYCKYGYQTADDETYIYWRTIKRNKIKRFRMDTPWCGSFSGRGAFCQASYAHTFVAKDVNGIYKTVPENSIKKIYRTDSGTIKVRLTIKNVGNKMSYYNTFEVLLDSGITIVDSELNQKYTYTYTKKDEDTLITIETNNNIGPGESYSDYFYFSYEPYNGESTSRLRRLLDPTKSLIVIKELSAIMDLNENKGDNRVIQPLENPLYFDYNDNQRPIRLISTISKSGSYKKPKFTVNVNIEANEGQTVPSYCFIYYRKIVAEGSLDAKPFEKITDCVGDTKLKDKPKNINVGSGDNYKAIYKIEAYKVGNTLRDLETSSSFIVEKSFPGWAIALIVIFIIILISLGVSLYFYYYAKKNNFFEHTTQPSEIHPMDDNNKNDEKNQKLESERKNTNEENNVVKLKLKENTQKV